MLTAREDTELTGLGLGSDRPGRAGDAAKLPPDGTPLYVTEWRRDALWLPAAVYGISGVCILAYLISKGSALSIVIYVPLYMLVMAASTRAAIAGLILDPEGVTTRTVFRTRRWRWDEIDHFELRPRGRPRLLVRLRQGQDIGVYGFYARSKEEQVRSEELFAALEDRRKAESA